MNREKAPWGHPEDRGYEIVPTSPVGDPSIFVFIQYLLSSFSIFPTSGRSFKQTLHSFKLTFLKQNYDDIILVLKNLCSLFLQSMCKQCIGIQCPLECGLNLSTPPLPVTLWICLPTFWFLNMLQLPSTHDFAHSTPQAVPSYFL